MSTQSNQQLKVRIECNRMFETKHSKTNRLKKTIKYKLNEECIKYFN